MNRSRYRNRILIAVFAISLCLLAIGKGFGEEFQGVGTVLALNPAEGRVALDHEELVHDALAEAGGENNNFTAS